MHPEAKRAVMLKLTQRQEGLRTVVKFEGTVRDPWLDEVRTVVAVMNHGSRRSLDLSNVTFADAAGIALLRELLSEGCQIEACSGIIASSLGLQIQ